MVERESTSFSAEELSGCRGKSLSRGQDSTFYAAPAEITAADAAHSVGEAC